jgi:NTE family protein
MSIAKNYSRHANGEQTVLVLQGGGALGAYQAGAYEELAANGYSPSWVAGISIGAINAALIAGNAPEHRVDRLRTFWETVTSSVLAPPLAPDGFARILFNGASASCAALFGVPGFFRPRIPPAIAMLPGAPEALSLYETMPLRETIEEFVDFDRINNGAMRLSLGAVNIRTGNFEYFDSRLQSICAEHVMASGALPPGLPPVEIDGEFYWDGGLVSNTPLQYVLDETPRPDMLVFQVDLFNARGELPQTLVDVEERKKEIQFSSRTRLNTDVFRQHQLLRQAAHRLVAKLPDELWADPDARLLQDLSCNAAITIVHLINRSTSYDSHAKDYEFSRASMEEHWAAGANDVRRTFNHAGWQKRMKPSVGVAIFDLTRDPAEEGRGPEEMIDRQVQQPIPHDLKKAS